MRVYRHLLPGFQVLANARAFWQILAPATQPCKLLSLELTNGDTEVSLQEALVLRIPDAAKTLANVGVIVRENPTDVTSPFDVSGVTKNAYGNTATAGNDDGAGTKIGYYAANQMNGWGLFDGMHFSDLWIPAAGLLVVHFQVAPSGTPTFYGQLRLGVMT